MEDECSGSELVIFLLCVSHLYLCTKSCVDSAISATVGHFATSDVARRFICGPDCSILAVVEL